MQPLTLDLHPSVSINVATIGREEQPIILVDNFLDRAEILVDYAATHGGLHYRKGAYPGVRLETPSPYMELMRLALGELICRTFAIQPQYISDVESFFSIVATPPNELAPRQRMPHIDGSNPKDIAFLHYLCGEKHGGTSFYKHKRSGYEYIDRARLDVYMRTLEAEMAAEGLPVPPQYMNGDTRLFERIASVKAKYNRLIIYRGTSLHSGDIGPDYAFDLNPRSGRLTITSFLYSAIY